MHSTILEIPESGLQRSITESIGGEEYGPQIEIPEQPEEGDFRGHAITLSRDQSRPFFEGLQSGRRIHTSQPPDSMYIHPARFVHSSPPPCCQFANSLPITSPVSVLTPQRTGIRPAPQLQFIPQHCSPIGPLSPAGSPPPMVSVFESQSSQFQAGTSLIMTTTSQSTMLVDGSHVTTSSTSLQSLQSPFSLSDPPLSSSPTVSPHPVSPISSSPHSVSPSALSAMRQQFIPGSEQSSSVTVTAPPSVFFQRDEDESDFSPRVPTPRPEAFLGEQSFSQRITTPRISFGAEDDRMPIQSRPSTPRTTFADDLDGAITRPPTPLSGRNTLILSEILPNSAISLGGIFSPSIISSGSMGSTSSSSNPLILLHSPSQSAMLGLSTGSLASYIPDPVMMHSGRTSIPPYAIRNSEEIDEAKEEAGRKKKVEPEKDELEKESAVSGEEKTKENRKAKKDKKTKKTKADAEEGKAGKDEVEEVESPSEGDSRSCCNKQCAGITTALITTISGIAVTVLTTVLSTKG